MIHVDPVPEPSDFDAQVRQPGTLWLANSNNANRRPRDLWSPFKPFLADGFHRLCGYAAMYEPVGTIEHYLSCENHRHLAYEWENYRFCSGWINSSKQTLDDQVLDPYEVGEDWFEILLPSLQLVLTDAVPVEQRSRAAFTLERLHLRDDERVIRQRQQWYLLFQQGMLSLEGLERVAPLIARAVRKQPL
jgi:hypothetical protein